MARPKSNHVQINISIPSEWKEQLLNGRLNLKTLPVSILSKKELLLPSLT